ncbi:MAG: hypothetical protein H0U18_17820 [Pyrinomonadaceae bacterium]|nr:hypothetical protein [Pyrinomonadaceae bacterium]
MLEQVKNSDLRVYSVYVPILESDDEASVPSAMKRLPDSRVVFYWDSKSELTKRYSRVLQLGEDRPAWDVYLVFERTAEWKAEPPVPDYWMHQLRGVSPERRLDGVALEVEIKKTLQRGKP